MNYPGIPDTITLDGVRSWVEPRISARRMKHVEGVVAVGKRIAEASASDPVLAELCGWLHDSCKEIKDKELVALARTYAVPLDPILELNGHLLHGPVAAAVAKRELAVSNQDVLDAVAQHTLGSVTMSTLSKVVFLADCLEESRPESYTGPIWKALDVDGSCNLDAAMVAASDAGLKFLIEDGKTIHPRTIEVRNYYLNLVNNMADKVSL